MPFSVPVSPSAPPARQKGRAAGIAEIAALTQAEAVHCCDGSEVEWERLAQQLVDAGTLGGLDAGTRPNSYWAASDPRNRARAENRTFICSEREADAGPTNNWVKPADMRAKTSALFDGCMRGRTMYLVPFSMGPIRSPIGALRDQGETDVSAIMRLITSRAGATMAAGAPLHGR